MRNTCGIDVKSYTKTVEKFIYVVIEGLVVIQVTVNAAD